jgi:S-adenosylmethionine/arginine decarboxylase-like enzyme
MRTETLCQIEKMQLYPAQQGALKRCIWWYHLIAEFWNSPFELLAEAKTVEDALKSALIFSKNGNGNGNGKEQKIWAISYQFQPFGVSAQVNSGTAQIYIHTWPEKGYSAIDILAETKEEAYKILKKLQENLKPKNVYIAELERGLSEVENTEGGET